jgi:two-component system cell cycle response regulator
MGLRSSLLVVIDPNPSSRRVLCEQVATIGLRIAEFTNSEEAQDVLLRAELPIVVLAVLDPERGLRGFIEQLETIPGARDIPLFALVSDPALIRPALEGGASDCLSIPCAPDELLLRLRVLLRIASRLEALASLSYRDELTRILNRRGLWAEMDNALARCRRDGTSLSLVVVDLDRFKEVNDRFGHPTGDLVLEQVAGVLERVARAGDVVGRLGGDEFLMILPQAGRLGAARVAERVQDALSSLKVGDLPYRVSASVGVLTTHPRMGCDRDSLLSAADRLMYANKRHRRSSMPNEDFCALDTGLS